METGNLVIDLKLSLFAAYIQIYSDRARCSATHASPPFPGVQKTQNGPWIKNTVHVSKVTSNLNKPKLSKVGKNTNKVISFV